MLTRALTREYLSIPVVAATGRRGAGGSSAAEPVRLLLDHTKACMLPGPSVRISCRLSSDPGGDNGGV
jgi:hypothetical protein